MGKKVDKSKEKILSALGHESRSDHDSAQSPEPYVCTGNFLNDFTELCQRTGMAFIPPVQPRPKVVIIEPKPEPKGKGKQVEPEIIEPELDSNGEPVEPPPKTFLLKEGRDCLKPCVQVDLEQNEKYETASVVYIRGWKLDEPMANTLKQTLPLLDKLHTINLWNTGLTGDVVTSMATFLPLCVNLKNLILDNNPVKEQNHHLFLSENISVTHVSMRHCQISEKGALGIGQALGTVKKYNTKLLSLNLSGNFIGSIGAGHIADGLRTNRCLLVLSLAGNEIGDEGVIKLAETLSRFTLTHEETVERRRLMSTYASSPDRPPSSKRAESRDRPTSGRSQPMSKREKATKKKVDAKGKELKEDSKTKKEEKSMKKATVVAEAASKGPAKTKELKKTRKEKSTTPHDHDATDTPEKIVALMEPVDMIDSDLLITGNLVLVSLNLARNCIGRAGMDALLKAIQYQTTLTALGRLTGTGLMRLFLQRNSVNSNDETLMKIMELMLPKDPMYKSPEEETPPVTQRLSASLGTVDKHRSK